MGLLSRWNRVLVLLVVGQLGLSGLLLGQGSLRFLTPERDEAGGVVLKLHTEVGQQYRVESSSDLSEWVLWSEFVASEGVSIVETENSSERSFEFFRATQIDNPSQVELDANRAKWEAIGWKNYRLRIDVLEFIPEEVSQGIITVENGFVSDVDLPLSEGDFFGFRFNYPLAIEGLFDRLQNALDQDPVQFRVTYHPDFGFPVEAFIDYDERIADEENGFRVLMLGPTRVEEPLSFELADDPFRIQSTSLDGNFLNVEVEYGGGCRGHLFALMDLMPGVFAESEPPRPVLALRHDSHEDLCKALVRETRSFDLSPLAVSATRTYGSPIPMILEFGDPSVSILYTPAGTREFLVGRATSQAWVGGVQGSGSGIDYRFKLTLVSDGIPPIDQVWIGKRLFEATVQLPAGKTSETVAVGDSVDVVCNFRRVPVFADLPFESEIVDWREEPPVSDDAPEYDGAALIRYEASDGPQELVIPSIEALPDLFFP